MRVWGKGGGGGTVGAADFEQVIRATRRQAIVRAGGRRLASSLPTILEICEDNDFDALCFVRPYLLIANRRGTDARLPELPERALVPDRSGVAVVATASLGDHPVVKSFRR